MDERLKYAPCGYISITHEGIVTEVNQTFLDMMGYTPEDLVHKHIESIMSTANKLIFHSYFYPFINLDGHVEELYLRLKDRQGESIPYILNGRRYEMEGVEIIDCVLVQMGKRIDYELELRSAKKQMEDAYWDKDQALVKLKQIHMEIEQKQQELMDINAVLVELSYTDKLTGLKNRRFVQEKLEEQLIQYGNTQEPFSICILDIDYFKKVNDTWGHQTGDEVLEKLADVLISHSRHKDVVARYGGEEFVMILPDMDIRESKIKAENLRHAIENIAWDKGNITVSIGVATVTPRDSDTTILKQADLALYASKENGRNRVTHIIDLDEEPLG
ncbi:sensor domain-containing diguanylate cyclase [Paenibacillus macquariensis]|uniref:PAS domain S-box-containing protein/diguanylate cyclase (GGDEF) domain-containing protein n=1 Tax=Paenibacillus macquariensis TaxID=948756 RepID=A0ABY1K3U4_9BACL|nr:sensor domain-containing diguanylate cyclase [Paenibacillus macquariensis]MEC0088905.1 sensor domain-containing diguanylate cyclase [Paenibacillus macquariensis]OAB31949.1 PAS domain S-box protein [Paenibacillus macquariensis subsp. macquariensis]SIR22414.1 PAS domain S-box-containing protein/diguanylate cyclase (GGDEF) domain-containing protein [Paenibacillus macquariensis]